MPHFLKGHFLFLSFSYKVKKVDFFDIKAGTFQNPSNLVYFQNFFEIKI
jgi:hypothetical protein